MNPPSVFLVAGEVSGDMHAAALVRAVLKRRPEIRFFGVGGDALRRAGMEVVQDNREMAVLGLTEVLKKYFFFRGVFNAMVALAEERRPDAVLLVDYPGFNLRFARRIHRRGLKVIYFICPQVWAWDRGRIPMMAKIVDRLIAIFPFEPAVFANTGLKVDFVGHPLVDKAREALAEPLQPLPWNGAPRIALLPGSREQELSRIFPVMWQAAGLVAKRHPEAGFIVAAPSEDMAARARELMRTIPGGPPKAGVVAECTRQTLRQATAAFVASGTATLEATLMRCPMVIAYKVAWLTYWLGRMLVRLSYLGMVNVIADRQVCPEFIQHDATPGALANAIEPLLTETPERTQMQEGLDEVVRSLGQGGAIERAAEAVLEELAAKSKGLP